MASEPRLDGYLTLKKGKKFSSQLEGDTQDAAKKEELYMEIASFSFGRLEDMAAAQARARSAKQAQRGLGKGDSGEGKQQPPTIVYVERPKSSEDKDDKKPKWSFAITKQVDIATPHLMYAYFSTSDPLQSEVFEQALVVLRKSGFSSKDRMDYVEFDFNHVVPRGWVIESESENAYPNESVTFAFQAVTFKYYPQDATGARGAALAGGWDFMQNIKK